MESKRRTNKQTSFKLVVLTFLMFGFGFSLIPFYDAICEATGINILAAKEKSDVKVEEIDAKGVDYTRQVTVEFDSIRMVPGPLRPKNPPWWCIQENLWLLSLKLPTHL